MNSHEHEPVRGLPGHLPAGERIIWQTSPDWRMVFRIVLHSRWVLAYFAALGVFALAANRPTGAMAALIGGLITLGLLALFAVLVARTTIYTLTDRRIVLRIGIALNKCINLPLGLVASANFRPLPGGHGDIALTLAGRRRLGYAMLWPHARPWHLARPEPMLRAIPDAQNAARALARACAAVGAGGTTAEPLAGILPSPPVRDEGLQGAAA